MLKKFKSLKFSNAAIIYTCYRTVSALVMSITVQLFPSYHIKNQTFN